MKDELKGATTFNNRLLNSYHGILENVRSSKATAMLTYIVSQSSYDSLYLRERNSSNLNALLDNELELEGSMLDPKLLASSHPHYPMQSGCEKAYKASTYTQDLVNSCLHEVLLTLSGSKEDERESFGVTFKLQNQLSKESFEPITYTK